MLAFQLAYGIFQVPGGLLGDRLGGRRVLTLLVLGWSLLIGAVALAASFRRNCRCRSFSCWCCDFSSACSRPAAFPR